MDEHSGCKSTSVTFFIMGISVDPDEITKTFDITPTTSHSKGDVYQSKAGPRVRGNTQWSVRSEQLTQSKSTEKHALALLEVLEPKKHLIQKYAEASKARIGISIMWKGLEPPNGGFSMMSETMRRLMDLCKEVDFHFVIRV